MDRTVSRAGLAPLLGVGLVAAGVLAVGITAAAPPPLPGLPDAGPFVRAALPGVRTVSEIAAVLVVGALLAASVLIPVGSDRKTAVRFAGRAAGWWAVLSAAMVVLTVSDALGQPLSGVLSVLAPMVGRFSVALAWLVVANIAALVWIGTRMDVRPVILLAATLVGIAPVALTGHSSSGGDHDIASDSLALHVVAMSVWIGGLVALLLIARRRYAVSAAVRYSAIALACWSTMFVTGVVNASLRLSLTELFTRYGVLVLAKTAAIILLGVFGYLHRQHTLARLARGEPRAFLRLGSVEVLVMLLTVGIAVGLSRTPAPVGPRTRLSATEVLVGFPLPHPPSLSQVLSDWRPDLVFGTAAVAAAGWYLYRLNRRTDPWPIERTAAWLVGCALLFVATCSGLGKYEPAVFSAHIGVQLLVGLLVPLLLARGKPLALAGPLAIWVPRPDVAAYAAAVIPVVLYGFGIYGGIAGQHWARLVVLGSSLIAGLALFARTSRTPVVTVALAHGLCGLVLLCRETALGRGFYTRLAFDWPHDLLADQVYAGWLMMATSAALACYAVLSTRRAERVPVEPLVRAPARTSP
ncbi:cytochrome c oxidase assembly protein [Actinokineospora enzanensis]|uniref:cytochrome c oxidase assembly protein n=1 Tax=Actinokineospora enzanensis TaxID=155975 RepID=UPI00036DBAD5|nr:cytochrome c oxidase assembly protein [Actinokineospora enzanensis]